MPLSAQPSLESIGWNKGKHDVAKIAIGDFWFYNNVPFHATRSLYAITVCGQGFKAPNDEEIKDPILSKTIADVKAKIAEQCSTVFLKSIDASGNIKMLSKFLMERHPTLFWASCAAHCLDLILDNLGKIPWIKTCVEIGRNICKYIYNHAWVLNFMENSTNKKELAHSGIIRFATNFFTLESLLQSNARLKCMFVSEEWTTSSYAKTTIGIETTDRVFDEHSFWQPTRKIVRFIEPLLVLLRVAHGEKLAMGYIYEGMDRMHGGRCLVDREAEAVVMAEEEARARRDPLGDPEPENDADEDVDVSEAELETQAEIMAAECSKTSFRHTRRIVAGSSDIVSSEP
ncbi:uncharacterized protein LOC131031175 [Cryptomeria japonica]|uniref:uncharacterized protein LOC131031175 n=1 Tax=Cryptomeria japonica TaxID=3369 RepID=UPI0027DA536D|nr:uncharacterized protein LOC131031175 [Cryptomeria japonica]